MSLATIVQSSIGMPRVVLSASLGLWLAACNAPPAPRTFYVDAVDGRDTNTGLGEAQAWQSLEQVSAASLTPGDAVLFKRGQRFRGVLAVGRNAYAKSSGSTVAPLRFGAYGTGDKPIFISSVSRAAASDWADQGDGTWRAEASFENDVGNVLLIDGTGVHAGRRRWARADLANDLDFFSDPATHALEVRSVQNPATRATEGLEIAVNRRPNIYVDAATGVEFEDLDLRYSGSHGVAVSNADHLAFRRLDVSWAGGANNFEAVPSTAPVRYGNGIQLYAAVRDVLVEGCRVHDVYDTALTNQYAGSPPVAQARIVYRFNTLWNTGMTALEVWVDEGSTVDDVTFDHNTTWGSGEGFGAERPDPISANLLWWYGRHGVVKDVKVRNNLFAGAAQALVLQGDATRFNARNVTCDHNGFFAPGPAPLGVRVETDGTVTPFASLAAYQAATGWDLQSVEVDPGFLDPTHGDFRLSASSAARGLATSLGYTTDGQGRPLPSSAALGAEQ